MTIFGTGFSATASQNTVKFNGISATVTSATPTQLVTQVPAGATTGSITSTTPTGSTTSTVGFTVTPSSGASTITTFTPQIGNTGTAVTINGMDFDTVLANNKVTLGGAHALISSAAATTLMMNVPASATSGRISVATPLGKTVSNEDFFVPPSPYTAADVEWTGRMAVGESQTVTINLPSLLGDRWRIQE